MAVNLSDVYDQEYVNRNMWTFEISGSVQGYSSFRNSRTPYANYGLTRLPKLVQSVNIPTFGFDTKQNETTKNIEIGKYEMESEFSVSVLDDTEHSISKWYYEWVDQFFDLQKKVYRKSKRPTRDGVFILYKQKKQSILQLLSGTNTPQTPGVINLRRSIEPTFSDESVAEIKKVRFLDILPKKLDAVEYNYTATDAPILTLTFICNQIISSDHPQYYQITGDPPIQ